jgi:3'(2'), 5'-bisphosphate nucleotidase
MSLKTELETAVSLARKAGVAVLLHYAEEVVAEEKLGADNFSEPVTAADREASRIIVAGLTEAFPDDGILSEEEADRAEERLSRPRVWMVDPIDGTLGFIRKDGDFGVQIGLAEGGEPVLGVVYLPFHDELFLAVRGGGAFLESKGAERRKLEVSDISELSQARLASSRSHRSERLNRVVGELGLENEVRRGSVGLKIGLIAKQDCDIYIHLSSRTKFWDSCAPQVIVEESGGTMTDLFGKPIRYDLHDVQNHNGIVASNKSLHEEAVDRLRPLLMEFGRIRK